MANINIKFHFQNMSGIYVHWNNGDSEFYNDYYPYKLEGFIIFHMEDGKVVEDYIQTLNTYNIRDYETLFKFSDIKQNTVPAHRNPNVKAVAKEMLFCSPRENPESWEDDYLWIHKDLVGFKGVTWRKEFIGFRKNLKPHVICFDANYKLQEICSTENFGEFKGSTEYDSTEHRVIKDYYEEAIKFWEKYGPRGIVGLEDKVKLYNLMINDLKRCLSRWENLKPDEIMQKHKYLLEDPDICMQNFGFEDFWKGGDK